MDDDAGVRYQRSRKVPKPGAKEGQEMRVTEYVHCSRDEFQGVFLEGFGTWVYHQYVVDWQDEIDTELHRWDKRGYSLIDLDFGMSYSCQNAPLHGAGSMLWPCSECGAESDLGGSEKGGSMLYCAGLWRMPRSMVVRASSRCGALLLLALLKYCPYVSFVVATLGTQDGPNTHQAEETKR